VKNFPPTWNENQAKEFIQKEFEPLGKITNMSVWKGKVGGV
jgi:hypothetical protein